MKKIFYILLILLTGLLFINQNVLCQKNTPVSGNVPAEIQSNESTTSNATWPLSGTSLTATVIGNVTADGMSLPNLTYSKSDANFGYGVMPAATGNSWWTAKNTDNYENFDLGPTTGNTLTVASVSMYLGASGGGGICCEVDYSNDGTNFNMLTSFSDIAKNSQSSFSVNVASYNTVSGAGKFYVRVYPWYGDVANGKAIFTDNVVISGTSNPLPVEMTTYSAKVNGQVVTLNWATATEVQNSGWDIERSNGNNQWTKIGFVQGNGNSNSPHQYSYVDKSIKQNGSYVYRLKQIDVNGTMVYTREVEAVINVPLTYSLNQNYPNPFNPSTTISYELPVASKVLIKVYNILGDEVATLVNENKEAGRYSVVFPQSGGNPDASRYSSGIYFYMIQAANLVQTKKMILLR